MMMPLIDLATSGFILFATRKCDRKSKSSKTFARAQSSGVPLKELLCVKLRRLTGEHISKDSLKSLKIHDYTCRTHVLHDVCIAFCERTCKHKSKRKSRDSSERRFNNLLL